MPTNRSKFGKLLEPVRSWIQSDKPIITIAEIAHGLGGYRPDKSDLSFVKRKLSRIVNRILEEFDGVEIMPTTEFGFQCLRENRTITPADRIKIIPGCGGKNKIAGLIKVPIEWSGIVVLRNQQRDTVFMALRKNSDHSYERMVKNKMIDMDQLQDALSKRRNRIE